MGNTFMTALNIYNVRHLKDIIIPLVRFNFFINIILSVCKYLLLRYIEMWVQ